MSVGAMPGAPHEVDSVGDEVVGVSVGDDVVGVSVGDCVGDVVGDVVRDGVGLSVS